MAFTFIGTGCAIAVLLVSQVLVMDILHLQGRLAAMRAVSPAYDATVMASMAFLCVGLAIPPVARRIIRHKESETQDELVWGSVQELMDVTYNARAFYGGTSGPNHGSPRGPLDIPGWASMRKGQAAQAAQVSAFPELYDRWERQASAIVDALVGIRPARKCIDTSAESSDVVPTEGLSRIRQEILRVTRMGVGGSYVWGGTAFKAWDCLGLCSGSIDTSESSFLV